MNQRNWQVILGVILIAVSSAVYFLQIALFHNVHDTLFYLAQDLAFVPINVLLVTLFLNKILAMREKQAMMNKLNMVIGTFFSEVGTPLLRTLTGFDKNFAEVRSRLHVTVGWSEEHFSAARRELKDLGEGIDARLGDRARMSSLLIEKRNFLVQLLENQNLLEHETFTELLWAVFHLAEELAAREGMPPLPPHDLDHLSGDIKRAYVLLIAEWLSYMKHLKTDYPYLYSFSVRMSPFNPDASPLIEVKRA